MSRGTAVAPPRAVPGRARRGEEQQAARIARSDILFAGLGLAMWGGTAVKCAPYFTPSDLAQCGAGLVAMLVISVAWPLLWPAGYQRWRVPAIAFLQLFLFALPFNFSTAVFDVLAPHHGTGRLAWVYNVFQLFMSIRVALLLFTSVGWRLPLHTQILVQALKVMMLAVFGTRPYCQSKLLSSPEMVDIFAKIHSALAVTGMPLMPLTPASSIIPHDDFSKRAAVLLLSWLILGWLVPALLLLPEAESARSASQQPRRAREGGSSQPQPAPVPRARTAGELVEAALSALLPPPGRPATGARRSELPGGLMVALRWWILVQVLWGACCVAAPLFSSADEAP
ncbi:hypothetical protein Rsub_12344 [Raphidocelis subcapitata]|uniref:Uncharacterized protein n=1 Tax=Raphidocelis subcapitata TaxID=307507 RepID=A0A2V0PIB4_9CHLO|nr:hypothetical protein Rsub_12344 [Raphidocelis subcapitata]|eukprot:GBF99538.1 hypothetical protein Rsub_12344 [Raphidocelis subcapitata]